MFYFIFIWGVFVRPSARKERVGMRGRLSGRGRRDWKLVNDEVSARFTTVAWGPGTRTPTRL